MVRNTNGRSRTPRALRREKEIRREILRSAAAAFRKRGFAATGMRDIALSAGLSPANLYYYFQSKQELLYFCQDHSLDLMLAACREAGTRRITAREKLARVVRAHLSATLDELDGAAAHLELDALPPALRRKIVAKRDRYEHSVRRLVERGVRTGQFAPCDATLVTRAILGALNWTARWYLPGGALSKDDLAESYARYLVRGLLP
ncbi:MAG: TetR/AcrR family transcriptional regulator [Acidobacteriota bacterium]